MGTYVGDDKTNEIQWQRKSGRAGLLLFIGTDVAVEHVAHHAWVCHFGRVQAKPGTGAGFKEGEVRYLRYARTVRSFSTSSRL